MSLAPLLGEALDLDDPRASEFLSRAQGNIIKGHGRDYTAHLFLTFGPNKAAVCRWIGNFAGRFVGHAGTQLADTERWRTLGGTGVTFHTFFLSSAGYTWLELPNMPSDAYFRAGMKASPEGVNNTITDPPVARWEPGFRNRIDAMVLVADDSRHTLDARVEELLHELAQLCTAIHVERGEKLVFDFGGLRTEVEIEHFGHQDGISNPRVVKQHAAEEIAEQGSSKWNPTAPLRLLFVDDPGQPEHYGSYLVFRKLEQDVAGFHKARAELAAALCIDPELAAALAVGRFRDGRPIMSATSPQPRPDRNDFSFKDDKEALVCPYQSHIRKTNPRGDLAAFIPNQTDDSERMFRIARRGITYGSRPDLYPGAILEPPSSGVGLLFMSYQHRLINFVIQQEGSDGDDFVRGGVGVDAVLGAKFDPQTGAPQTPIAQKWPFENKPEGHQFVMANFVRMLGGEYFFAPSRQFLVSLGK